jgi:hypothetical protein
MSPSRRSGLIVGLFVSALLAEPGAWAAEPDPTTQWEDRLAGMVFKRESSHSSGEGGGFTATSVWHLCRGGSFRYSHSSTASVEAPGSLGSSTSQISQTGRWSVAIKGGQALLVLRYKDGTQTSYALAYDGVKTYLEGEPLFPGPSRNCP